MDDSFEFLTYEVAATRLGISVDSVRRQARRKKWPRKPGNDGSVRVGVPQDRLEVSPKDSPAAAPGPVLPSVHELQARVRELEAELVVAGVRLQGRDELLAAAVADRDAWRRHAQRPFWKRFVA